MGNCWGPVLPEEEATKELSDTVSESKESARKAVEFGKEELKLDELLASVRTGLVFAPTEFSVLPDDINTTGAVAFTIGNSEIQQRQKANHLRNESDSIDNPDQVTSTEKPYQLKLALKGQGWVKGLVMILGIQPVLGPFSRRHIKFQWRGDVLEVTGAEKGELEAHSLPLSIESELQFCQCCLQLIYQSSSSHMLEECDDDCMDSVIPALKHSAYKAAIANLDTLSVSSIPAKLRHIFFGIHDPVTITITLWPNGNTIVMKVKSGILFGELVFLIKERLNSTPAHLLKLYHDHMPVTMSDIIPNNLMHLECLIIDGGGTNITNGLCLSPDGVSTSSNTGVGAEILVVSFLGKNIQSIEANSDMPMKEFDALVRKKFKATDDNFLIILAEDDFAPQYTADDNWKCTHTFSIPGDSFTTGLRRSFRRLSTRGQGTGERTHTPSESTVTSNMVEVIELLSSDKRQFPRCGSHFGLSIDELYKSMPMYSMSIEQCGIHPYSMIQVFEPSIPVTVRVLSDYSQRAKQAPYTRLANILDINPEWTINTFFRYIDAVVSLSSSARKKKLILKNNSLCDKNDLSTLTLGAILDSWKPLWWAEKGQHRRRLTTKDIDPTEYLIVENC